MNKVLIFAFMGAFIAFAVSAKDDTPVGVVIALVDEVEINNLEEIVDVTNVKITNETGGRYSDETLNLKHYTSADGRILYVPENAIYELKYPNLDIKGTIR